MTTLFLTLAILLLLMGLVIFAIGAKQAFKEELKWADWLISHSMPTEKSYNQVKTELDHLSRMPFRNQRKVDELIRLFYKKFKFQIYIDFSLPEMSFYKRLVKLTA